MCARDENVEAGSFENFGGGSGGRREEVVVESIGPQEDGSAGVSPPCITLRIRCGRARGTLDSRRATKATFCLPPLFKCLRSQRRNAALGGDSAHQLDEVAQPRELSRQIHQTRRVRRGSEPEIDIRERQLL